MKNKMLYWFEEQTPVIYADELYQLNCKYLELADWIANNIETSAEQTVALRKLLESKDSAIRALINPGV